MTISNWLNESTSDDDINSQNKPKKDNNNLSFFKKLAWSFARKTLSWDDTWNHIKDLKLYNKYNDTNYKKKNFIDDFEMSLSDENKKIFNEENYENDEQKSNDLYEKFKREVNKIGIIYENKKDKLNDIVGKKYNLSSVWNTNVLDAIKKLDSQKLDELVFSPEEFDEFIKKTSKSINNQSVWLKEVKSILKKVSFGSKDDFVKNIEEAIEKNSKLWTKEEIYVSIAWILNTIKSWEELDSTDIKTLFSYNIFKEAQKKEFLKIFLPIISLQELIDSPLEIIKEEEAKEIKKEQIISSLKKKRNVDKIEKPDEDNELINALEDIDFKDIFVAVDKYIDSHIVKLEDSELFNQTVAKSFNKTVKEFEWEMNLKILTLDIFKKKVHASHTLFGKIQWGKESLDKLWNWSIIKFGVEKNENSFFYEATNFSDNWSFSWKNKSINWKYNSSTVVEEESKKYQDLFELFWTKTINNIEIITPEELKSKIESWVIQESKNELWEPWKFELNKYKEKINDEIEKLKVWKTQEELDKNPEYERLMKLKDKLESENALDDISIKEDLNKELLLSKIDEIDKDWKEYWLKEWVSFKSVEWVDKEFRIFTIFSINQLWKTIEIRNAVWDIEKVTFDQFYKGFSNKDSKVTRFTNNSSFSWLIENFSQDWKLLETWKDFEVKDNNLMKKNQEKVTYPYLVQDVSPTWKADKLLKIHDVVWAWSSQMVWISFWDVWQEEKTTKEKDEKWKFKKKKVDVYNVDSNINYVSIWFLENYIKENGLKPKTLEKEKEKTTSIPEWLAPKWSITKRFLWNKSVHEIIWWLKMWFTQFTEHLKWWNEEHQAKIALLTWGKFLPIEVKTELKSRVESASKKRMDDAVSRLGAIDTSDAINLIYKRITYKNTEEYKKEAAMIFMMTKYGTLYNKNYAKTAPLNSKKWEFLWFKSLSWYWGDVTKHPLYISTKADCENSVDQDWKNRNFTEEELVWKLMKEQCKPEWYNWISRRSRLHKEVEKLKKAWIDEELADWEKKWWETRNPGEQLQKWIDEIKSWSPGNAVWRYKALVDRGSSMNSMNTIPLIFIYSWLARSIPEHLCNKVKSLTNEWRCLPLARFMSYPKDIDLAMKTIRILANKIQEREPGNYPDIWTKANELYNDFVSWKVSERDRIENVIKFFKKTGENWKTYWDILTRVMYMSADWKDSDLNSLLLIEKDKPWEDWAILKDFFGNQQAYINVDMEIKDGYFADSFNGAWLSSLQYKVVWQTLKPSSSWSFSMGKAGPFMVEEIKKEIEAIKTTRKYKNEAHRKIRLKHYLKNIFAWLTESAQSRDLVSGLFRWVGALRFFNQNRWINFEKIIDAELDTDEILNWKRWDKVIDKFADDIINNQWTEYDNNIFAVSDKAKEKVKKITNPDSENND